jgi:transposase
MYLRWINRKKNGKDHFYRALVESYRTEKGSRQRIVGYIGDVTKSKVRKIAQSVQPCDSVQQDFFSPEEAFRIHKSDVNLRPIRRQKDERIEAHILVCFLAFVLWKSFCRTWVKGALSTG